MNTKKPHEWLYGTTVSGSIMDARCFIRASLVCIILLVGGTDLGGLSGYILDNVLLNFSVDVFQEIPKGSPL